MRAKVGSKVVVLMVKHSGEYIDIIQTVSRIKANNVAKVHCFSGGYKTEWYFKDNRLAIVL
jgi:hypothetical protein